MWCDLFYSFCVLGHLNLINVHATCDNVIWVWVNGAYVDLDWWSRSNWDVVSTFPVARCSRLLAIQCEDTALIGGIMVSDDAGMITDDSWRCSTTWQYGWHQLDFIENPAIWGVPLVYGTNGNTAWPYIHGISSSAQWIWYGPNYGARATIYCRKLL